MRRTYSIGVYFLGIKGILRKNKIIYSLNAKIKAFLMVQKLEYLNKKYDRLVPHYSLTDQQVEDLFKEKIKPRLKNKNDKFNVFWVGANHSQDYSGFAQALEKLTNFYFFKNVKNEYGLEFTSAFYDPNLVKRNSEALRSQIDSLNTSGVQIDLILGQMWANYISPDTLSKLRDEGHIVINISMDDRLPELWDRRGNYQLGAAGLAKSVDLTLTTSPECCKRFYYHGGLALFWPLASDPDIFHPDKKKYDVSFVGNKYGIREKIITALTEAGIEVEAFGAGWKNGSIASDKVAEVFNSSKIILGIGTIGHCEDVYTLKLRDFDATMTGALYITHRNPDLLKIFDEDRDIVCYSTEKELVEKVKYYLKNPDLAEEAGNCAAKKARQHHTWNARLSHLLSLLS